MQQRWKKLAQAWLASLQLQLQMFTAFHGASSQAGPDFTV